MSFKSYTVPFVIGACTIALCVGGFTSMTAQQSGGAPASFLTTADANKDGFVTREELRAAVGKWIEAGGGSGSLTQDQLATALDTALPSSVAMSLLSGGRGPQNQVPNAEDVQKMMASLPAKAPAKAKQPRKILVLSKCAGFVHSCIPLAAKTVEALGSKTGAWTTTVTYDSADINTENLKQYDAILLNNTTGFFLDDANNPTATEARKKALLEFVRSGKGLAGIHAATDSYHKASDPPPTSGRGGRGMSLGPMLAGGIMTTADKDSDKKISAAELQGLADGWFDKVDTEKAGKVSQQNLTARFGQVMMGGGAAGRAGSAFTPPAKGRPGRDTQIGTWPEFNTMIGGFFKYHWFDPTHINYKIDDPNSPLTAMFKGLDFAVDDETYTFGVNTWSRENLHILTSVDYSKMSEADKLKEDFPREDHDYGLSWIRREGKGRVFYEAHGHAERNYAVKPLLEHILAGVQYALGDLKANDDPSVKK